MIGLAINASLAALLVLQQPDGAPDSTKAQQYVSVGGAGMAGYFVDIQTETAGTKARLTTRRPHHYAVYGAIAGWRKETRNWGFGLRGQVVRGTDHGGQREVITGFRSKNAGDAPYSETLGTGSGVAADVDWTYLGVTAGVIQGMEGLSDKSRAIFSPIRTGAVRVGVLTHFYAEYGIHDHIPAPVPGPMRKLSMAFIDERGTSYRIGIADPGPFVEMAWLTRKGYEINPFISGGDVLGFNLSLRVSRRLRLGR